MKTSYDVFAETNPAFCAAAIVEFTKAYLARRSEGPEMPLAYLALPIALSGELAGTFDGTNKKTGLLAWLERSPQVQVGLVARLNASFDIVTDAIRFGCFADLLTISNGARLHVGKFKVKATILAGLGDEPSVVIKHSERLGHWFATAGSTRATFNMMGLTA